MFLPKWFYFNLYHVSAWTRTMILPLGIVTTLRPVRQLPPDLGIAELYIDHAAANRLGDPVDGLPTKLARAVPAVDRLLKIYKQSPIAWLRDKAMRQAGEMAAGAHGRMRRAGRDFSADGLHPDRVSAAGIFRRSSGGRRRTRICGISSSRRATQIRIQPCLSPVWDTGIALHALAEAGLDPDSDAARRATQWLLEKECKIASDWQKNCPAVEPAGGFSSSTIRIIPTSTTRRWSPMALNRAGGKAAPKPRCSAAVNWLLAMQNDDGGWAAFDHTNDRPILEKIPFADHNAMQDPSCPDITGRVLECLGHIGFHRRSSGRSSRGIDYIRTHAGRRTAAGGAAGASTSSTAPGRSSAASVLSSEDMTQPWIQRPPTGCAACKSQTAASAKPARATMTRRSKAKAPAPLTNRLGRDGPDGGAGRRRIRPWSRRSTGSSSNQAADGNWDEDGLRAPASRRCSI